MNRLVQLTFHSRRALIAVAAVAILCFAYFSVSYRFHPEVRVELSGKCSAPFELELFFDSGDGFTSYEHLPVKIVSHDLTSGQEFHVSDAHPKSAYELAMERLRKKDAEEGVTTRPLTGAEKAAIAEVRNIYAARLAQEDVLYQSKMRTMIDPAERDEANRQFRRERERLSSERDAKIEKIRKGEG